MSRQALPSGGLAVEVDQQLALDLDQPLELTAAEMFHRYLAGLETIHDYDPAVAPMPI